MNLKWIGAVTILLGCGGVGFRLVANHRQQEKELRDLLSALDLMTCELRYRMTPLPELCLQIARVIRGAVGKVFRELHRELDRQIAPDAGCCMNAVLSDAALSGSVRQLLGTLGRTLGRFDLEGQLQGIEAVRMEAVQTLDTLTRNRDSRLRCYQTLGLCAGVALAILLL